MRKSDGPSSQLEKAACGPFSDSSSVAASKRRDFCWLPHWCLMRRKSDKILKAEDSVAGCAEWRIQRCRNGDAQCIACIHRVQDAVIPQLRRGIVRGGLLLVRLQGLLSHLCKYCRISGLPYPLELAQLHLHKGVCGLFASHHRDPVIRPAKEESPVESAPAHAVVASTKRPVTHHGELRHVTAGLRHDHFGAVLRDPGRLVLRPDHIAGDVLQEQERRVVLVCKLDEMTTLD